MLADEFRNFAVRNSTLVDNIPGASLSEAITGAVRIVLSPEVAGAAAQVHQTRPSSMLKALPLCRLPFRNIWIEWKHGDRHNTLGTDNPVDRFRENRGYAGGAPSRMGILIQGNPDHVSGVATFAWEHRSTGVNMCALSAIFAFDGRTLPDPMGIRSNPKTPADIGPIDPEFAADTAKIASNEVEFQAMNKINQAVSIVPNPYMFNEWLSAGDQEKASLFKLGFADLLGEPGYMMAILALLNSLSSTELADGEDFTKINRKRTRNGRLPLLDHKILRLKLTRTQKSRLEMGGIQPAQYRAHLVRGHFKIRKTGIFWWMPFVRGDIERGFVSHEYRAEP